MMSRPPNFFTAPDTIALASSEFDTSARIARASPPALVIRRTVSSAPAALTSTTATRAPSRAKSVAVARPIPEPAPVMSATLSLSLIVMRLADESQLLQQPAIRHWIALHARARLGGAGGLRDRIDEADRIRMLLERGHHFLRDEPHAGLAILVAHRTLHVEHDERAGTQRGQDGLHLWNDGLGAADHELH